MFRLRKHSCKIINIEFSETRETVLYMKGQKQAQYVVLLLLRFGYSYTIFLTALLLLVLLHWNNQSLLSTV